MKYLLNIDTEDRQKLWRSFKAKTALAGESMVEVIFQLIKEYLNRS